MSAGLDKAAIVRDLGKMGLHPSCHLMIHASLSALGFVEGGPETVVEALREIAGEDGSVIIPSFRDAIRSDHYSLSECGEKCAPPLCASRERGYSGAIGETVRAQPDALRSCHATHSWVGLCNGARYLLEGHFRSQTPCGNDSPFFRLMDADGLILLLGVGVNSITNIHAVEDARNVPYLSAIDPRRRHATYTTSGRRIQYVYPELLHAALRQAGILRSGRVGAGASHVLSARDLGTFFWIATDHDPWCLALRPRGEEYLPFQDACSKVSGMIRAWENNPDRGAWRRLLEESGKPREPVLFTPTKDAVERCPAYRGMKRGYPRCAANDVAPWEKFEDYPPDEPGVATCQHCNWPRQNIR
jgi:aminoglycoside 3-N-acetyltransferase